MYKTKTYLVNMELNIKYLLLEFTLVTKELDLTKNWFCVVM